MGDIELTAGDGHRFSAYRAEPSDLAWQRTVDLFGRHLSGPDPAGGSGPIR